MQGTLLDEETEIVFTGKVHKRVYEVLETRYRMMGFGDRQKYLSVILERLADVKKPYKIMAVLLLLNRMSKVSERVLLSAVNALVPAEDDKETVAEVNMMNYYYSFIGSTAAYYGCDLEAHDQFDLSSKLVKYCEDAVDKVISLLKV